MFLLKKKAFWILSVCIMALSLSACSSEDEKIGDTETTLIENTAASSDNSETKETEDISFESDINHVLEQNNSDVSETGREVWYVPEDIDLNHLADGTYPVKIFFDEMKRNQDSLSLDFMIYTVVHYAPEDIRTMTRDDILYEYVDETTTNSYVIDTVNFPLDEVCVVNGGSERGEGITLTEDKSGFFRVSINEVYTRHISHGMVTLDLPDTVTFEDNHALANASLNGSMLYDYLKGLNDTEKEYFNENNTFLTIADGKIVGLNRVYLP